MQQNSGQINKMVVFDMDNTLLQGRFIDACAEKFNFIQALDLLRQIDHNPVSLTRRIGAFLKDKRKEELIEIAESISLVPGIEKVVKELKRRNYIIAIISDSYQLITEYVGKKIQADYWLANELVVKNDYFTGEVILPYYFFYNAGSTCTHQVCKTNALRHLCSAYQVSMENCIVVGDSENDICMIKHAGIGVAFCSHNELLNKTASNHIRQQSFSGLLQMTV